MSQQNQDGRVDLEFNLDRTQVFATVHPANGAGRSITPQDILDHLRIKGVQYGFRENDIQRAANHAHGTGTPAVKILVAQGILPEDGVDAQLLWKVDLDVISKPIAYLREGLIDYFALAAERSVTAGQVLASIIPARPGSPGQTLTAPLKPVFHNPGKEVSLTIGPSVRLSEDRLHFYADADGFAEYRRGRLSVLPLSRVEGDLGAGDHAFTGGALILGDLKGANIKAHGTVAIRGTTAGGMIRTHGDVILARAARTKVIAEGNIYVMDRLLHCDINTRGKLIALNGAAIVGGNLIATEGVEAAVLGAADFTQTQVCVGVDRLSDYRLKEVEEEVKACESNIQRIGQVLRPLNAGGSEPLSAQKKQMMQTLVQQRRSMEARVRLLHGEKRQLMMNIKKRMDTVMTVSQVVYPGVWITMHEATILLETPQERVMFVEDSGGRHVRFQPLRDTKAA